MDPPKSGPLGIPKLQGFLGGWKIQVFSQSLWRGGDKTHYTFFAEKIPYRNILVSNPCFKNLILSLTKKHQKTVTNRGFIFKMISHSTSKKPEKHQFSDFSFLELAKNIQKMSHLEFSSVNDFTFLVKNDKKKLVKQFSVFNDRCKHLVWRGCKLRMTNEVMRSMPTGRDGTNRHWTLTKEKWKAWKRVREWEGIHEDM